MSDTSASDDEALTKEVEVLAEASLRQMFVMIFAGFFLLLTLSAPDSQLVRADASISWPLIRTDVQLSALLLYAPIALLAIMVYLHLFYGRLLDLGRRGYAPPQTYLFAMKSSQARITTDLIMYAYIPCLLVYFTWRVIFRDEAQFLLAVSAASVFTAALLYYVRARMDKSRVRRGVALTILALFATAAIGGYAQITTRGYDDILRLRDIDLKRADLGVTGSAPYVDLTRLKLSHADVRNARLAGADLREAVLNQADMRNIDAAAENEDAAIGLLTDFARAKLRGTNLQNADLRYANFSDAELIGANLRAADLRGANFGGAALTSADMAQAVLGATSFAGADLREADLTRATATEPVRFDGADMTAASLNGTVLSRARFVDAELAGALFDGAKIDVGSFSRADLNGACLTSAELLDVNFQGASLVSADLGRVTLTGGFSSFIGANLTNATLLGAVGFEKAMTQGTCICNTTFPDGTIRNDDCDENGFLARAPGSCAGTPTEWPARPLAGCTASP